MSPGERAAEAARACVGVRFVAQGCDPASGLDCVGLAAVAARAAGYEGPVSSRYHLRTGSWDADVPGLVRCDGEAPGDLLLCRVSSIQLHLAVRTRRGIVHADMAARRVVERPGPPPWPIERALRVAATTRGE